MDAVSATGRAACPHAADSARIKKVPHKILTRSSGDAEMRLGAMKKLVLAVVLGIVLTEFGETVTNVRGVQRSNSNLVDIYYDLNAVDGWSYTVEVAIEGRTNEVTATTFSGDIGEGVAPGKNRHIVWEAGADWRGKKGDVKAVVTAAIEAKNGKPKKVQLWAGGPYWADRNIGADNPWDYGLYFWWGDTVGHRPSGTTFNFSFSSSNCPTYNKSIDTLWSEGWIASRYDYPLAPAHDAAHEKWGGRWRMPRYFGEMKDLIDKCDWTWTTMNGVKGYVVRGRGDYASNSIFLPATGRGYQTLLSDAGSVGYYRSSELSSYYPHYSICLSFVGSGGYSSGQYDRFRGCSVRPVQ